MYFRWLLVSIVGARLALAETRFRRLIVRGPTVSINKYPFAVALLTCNQGSGGSMLCAQFCSGSLIAPDVVLTAGHCTHSASSPHGTSDPPVDLSTIYVLLGTDSPRDSSSNQKLVKVTSLVNKGYSLNVRYSIDGDVGLAFLDECVAEEPGYIETIKMATMDREPRSSNESCLKITAIGFGKSSNLPSPISFADGKLRTIDDVVHPFPVCLQSYIDLSLELQGYDSSILNDSGNEDIKAFFESFIVPEYALCHGGNTEYSTCSGDSGGPIVATDVSGDLIVIGVTSFGVGGFCGYGADYVTRLAPSSWFIADQMEKKSMKCAATSNSFITWPARNMTNAEHSSTYKTTRCLGEDQWQCGSGECISSSQVCNHSSQCQDDSDEDSTLCYLMYTQSSIKSKSRDTPVLTQHQKDAKAELDALIAQNQDLINEVLYHSRRLTEGSTASINQRSVIVVGSLSTSMGPPNKSLLPSVVIDMLPPSPRSDTPLIDPSAAIRSVSGPDSCTGTDTTLSSMLSDEVANGRNRAEQYPTPLTTACNDYVYCANSGNVTVDSTLSAFCVNWAYFVQNRTMAYEVSDNFNDEYNLSCTIATASSPEVTEGVPSAPTTTTVAPATSTTDNTTTLAPGTTLPGSTTPETPLACETTGTCSTSKAAGNFAGGVTLLEQALLIITTIILFCN